LLSKEAFTCAYTSRKRSSETTAPAARLAARQGRPYRAPVPLRRRYAPSGPDNRGNRVITAGDRRGCPESAHVPCPSVPARRPPEYTPTEFPTTVEAQRRNCRSNYFVTSRRSPQHLGYQWIQFRHPLRCESKWIDRPFISVNHSQSPAPACVRLPAGRRAAGPTPASIDDPTARPGGSRPGGPVPWPVPGWPVPGWQLQQCRDGIPGPDGSSEYTRSPRHFSANRTAAVRTDPDVGIVHAVQLADRRRRAAFRQ
jgi:hypothetical protein